VSWEVIGQESEMIGRSSRKPYHSLSSCFRGWVASEPRRSKCDWWWRPIAISKKMMEDREFRGNLYYRLNVFPICVTNFGQLARRIRSSRHQTSPGLYLYFTFADCEINATES
jgi:hypothetical protein